MKKKTNNHKIVIVDDESIVTSSLKTLLTLESDYDLFTFNSPTEALEFIKKTQIDLVISDFFMPDMNGIEFLKQVKVLYPDITLILLTGYADKESAIKAINEIGLYRYIEKPWDNEDLLLCIKNGIERSHLLENLNQKINELSETKKQLEKYNEKLELTVKERTSELEEINSKLNAVIDCCADGIIVISQDGKICQVNASFEKICKQKFSDISEKNISDLLLNNDDKPVITSLKNNKNVLLRDCKLKVNEIDRFIPVEINFAPIISGKNKYIDRYVGVIRDISSQYEAERLRDDFVATLTHDLKTPILATIQTLEFFLDGTLGELSEKQRKFLEIMRQSNQDLLNLVNSLLEVYKYESKKLHLTKEFFDLKNFMIQSIQEFQSLLEKKNISLTINNLQDKKIFAAKQELKRVISNLIANAINYTHSSGEIKISCNYDNDSTIIIIEDNGVGIPSEDLPKMFERFYQGTSKKRSCGTGLGLYLSRQIIETHGGKIWIESELGKGSKFIFTVPNAETKG